jgi:hypothetical protein
MKKKVSFKQFPFLNLIKNGKPEKEDGLFKFVNHNLTGEEDEYRNKIVNTILSSIREGMCMYEPDPSFSMDYCTDSYIKAAQDSSSCITDLLVKEFGDNNSCTIAEAISKIYGEEFLCGIIITNGAKEGIDFKVDPKSKVLIYECFLILDVPYEGVNMKTFQYTRFIQAIEKKVWKWIDEICIPLHGIKLKSDGSFEYPQWVDEYKRENFNLEKLIKSFIDLLVFKKLAQTEIELVDVVDTSKLPKNISSLQKQNLMNKQEGDITINYYSANWYTEIIRDQDFSVRGHWRNQPYKDGYKIIFIKPFVKHGYHRRAQKDL